MSTEVRARFVDGVAGARAVMAVLIVGALLDMQRLLHALSQQRTPDAILSLPAPTLHVVVRVATLLLFVLWFDRAWRNFAALAGLPPQSKGGTLAALFLPPMCLVRPVGILNQMWSATGARPAWFSGLVAMWWLALLTPPLIVVSGFRRGEVLPADRWLRVTAAETLNVVAGLLAIAIVYLISEKQSAMHEEWLASRRQRRDSGERAAAARPEIAAETPAAPVIAIEAAPVAGAPLRRRSVELLIERQTKLRPPLERAIEFLRGLVWPGVPRRR